MAKSTGKKNSQDLIEQYSHTDASEVTDAELTRAQELLEIELREEKAEAQKKMAWVAIFSMIAFSVLLFSPVIPESRVTALSDLLGLFYLAQAGVVGAYMGFTTWMTRS
jgi:hypothetical protein